MAPLFDAVHQWRTRALQHGTKQASMFAVAVPFIVITSVVVSLRLHVRLRLLHGTLATDDCRYI